VIHRPAKGSVSALVAHLLGASRMARRSFWAKAQIFARRSENLF
jgi:hypothetical protein